MLSIGMSASEVHMGEEDNYKNGKGFGRKCFWSLLFDSNKRKKGISGKSTNK